MEICQNSRGCEEVLHCSKVRRRASGTVQVPAAALSEDFRGIYGRVRAIEHLVVLRIHGCGKSADESETGKPNGFHGKTPGAASKTALRGHSSQALNGTLIQHVKIGHGGPGFNSNSASPQGCVPV